MGNGKAIRAEAASCDSTARVPGQPSNFACAERQALRFGVFIVGLGFRGFGCRRLGFSGVWVSGFDLCLGNLDLGRFVLGSLFLMALANFLASTLSHPPNPSKNYILKPLQPCVNKPYTACNRILRIIR